MRRALALTAALAFQSLALMPASADTAIFAGGCFWCVESDFDAVPGVTSTVSGYIGGKTDNPTYRNHSATGHREAVKIDYDPAKVSYEQLVSTFFRTIDPVDANGQFCDRGHSYSTAVYALDEKQAAAAMAAKVDAEMTLGQTVATEIVSAPRFWPAEDYHQNYYRTNPDKYKYYRYACGRDQRIQDLWGAEAFKGVPAH